MISLDSVEQSILELEQKDTSFQTCERLAWLYVVRDHLKRYGTGNTTPIDISGESEFLKTVNGKNTDAVWEIIDEGMEIMQELHPRTYDAIIEKIKSL